MEYKIEPVFNYPVVGLDDLKIGTTLNAIINYKVIERTRGVTILRVLHVQVKPKTQRIT